MPTSVATKNRGLDAMYPNTIYVSLHSGNPGDTGAFEIVAAGRKSAVLAPAANGQKACTSQPLPHDVPGGVTVDMVGFWSHATDTSAASFLGYKDVTNETYAANGQGQVNVQPFVMSDPVGG